MAAGTPGAREHRLSRGRIPRQRARRQVVGGSRRCREGADDRVRRRSRLGAVEATGCEEAEGESEDGKGNGGGAAHSGGF